ncbi:MAG: hypothetical protein V4520_02470 [Bacteroidota bacterium]
MLSINQLSKHFIEFFKNHGQINTVIYADDFDFSAYPDILYRVVHIQSVDSTVRGKELVSRFKFMIADIENPNNGNSENEIWSDTERIADDFLTFFGDDDFEDFLTDTDTTIQRFSESGTDRTAGVVFTANVRQVRELNPCAIPVKDSFNIVQPPAVYYGAISAYPDVTVLTALEHSTGLRVELATGLNNTFLIALLQGKTLESVIDTTASDLNLTELYELQGSLTNNDLVYNLYIMAQAVNYSINHKHQITIR